MAGYGPSGLTRSTLLIQPRERPALLGQPLDQRGDLPAGAVLGLVRLDLLRRGLQADDVVDLPHGAAAPSGEAVAVEVHGVAIAGPQRDALLQDLGALVGESQQAAFHDLLGGDRALLDL